MSDPLTGEERAAIARYTGPVTVCPPCTYSIDAATADVGWKAQQAAGLRAKARAPKPPKMASAEATRRRVAVAKLAPHMTMGQMAAHLDVSRQTIKADLKLLGIKSKFGRPGPKMRAERIAEILRLSREMTPTEVARAMNLSPKTVRAALRDSTS